MNTDYNLYPWQVFRVVARLGSVTRAAEELSISQPAVSAHIRSVETALGVALFERVSRRMVLTEVGQAVRERADRVISLYEELPDVVDEARRRVAGELIVAASSTPGTYRLPALLKKFERRYPEVAPLPRIGSSGEVLEWLLAWQAPLGIVGEIGLPEGIEAHPFKSDQLRLVVPSGDPLVAESQRRALTPEDLRRRALFVREPGSSTRAVVERLFGDQLSRFARLVVIPSTEAIKQSVAAGLGWAVLSSWACDWEEKAGVLTSIQDRRWRRSRRFYVVKRRDRELTGAGAQLWKMLVGDRGERGGKGEGTDPSSF
jgi:DNA-binding transcriptional LysR family regulator